MGSLKLSLIASVSERTEAILDGIVQPDGIDLTCVKRWEVADLFTRMVKYREFDVSEMGVSTYWMAKTYLDFPYIAIPVFPQGPWFFHTWIRYNTDSGIKSPSDLKGKRFGMPRFAMDLMLWIRGTLQHEFGVSPQDVEWYAERKPVQEGLFPTFRPPPNVKQIPDNKSTASMMLNKELDACFPYPAGLRSSLDRSTDNDLKGKPKIKRLFPDAVGEAIRYYQKTRFYHLNHLIIVREQVLKEHPWVASSLIEAFQKSKDIGYENTARTCTVPSSIVCAEAVMERVREAFGDNPFPYGFRANLAMLKAHAQYSLEQGTIPHQINVEELFATNTLET
jgi:4,5-dihydroxyphthalate decarboxylase